MRDFKKLEVWKESHDLAKQIYVFSRRLPDSEKFGIISQMKRAAVSIPTNIAEGCGQNSDAQMVRYLLIASGSASELEYLNFFCEDMGWGRIEPHFILSVKKMLFRFVESLTPAETRNPKPEAPDEKV